MDDKSPIKINDSVELVSLSRDELIANKQEIISKKVPVFRMNIENKLVIVPVDRLDHFLGDSSSVDTLLYITRDWQKAGTPPVEKNEVPSVAKPTPLQRIAVALEKYGKVDEEVEKLSKMTVVQREEILDQSIEKLHELPKTGNKFDIESIISMVEVVANTFYSNYANVTDVRETEHLRNNPYGIYIKTEWVIKLIVDYFKENAKVYSNYRLIDEISTGSYTIDNMNKGLLWFIGFCLFYNDYIDKGLINRKIRSEFKDRHLRYYRKRFPDQSLSVEKIVKDGLRRIDMETEIQTYALGALLYDIGKLPFVVYHDSTDDYDESIVKMHVIAGYNMIQSIRKYPFTVSAMVAFHHEYYGGKGGYNFTNPIITKLTKKKRTEDNAKYFITYNENEFKEGVALSLFPCKIIEIIDVFNALVHKKANTGFEALKIMKKVFITQSLKIDPILFEIFIEFKHDCGLLSDPEREELNSIKF
jgi:hypothetical protein